MQPTYPAPQHRQTSMNDALLLVTHVVLREGAHGLQIDDQTAAGIVQWCKHFQHVTYYGVIEDSGRPLGNSSTWVDIGTFEDAQNCRVLALPNAYRVGRMLGQYRKVRDILSDAIPRHSHLCFTIGGMIGDWPAVAALEAVRQERSFSAWIDRVESAVIKNRLRGGSSIQKRLAAKVILPLMERYTEHILRKSGAALLQGMDTFNHYSSSAPNPHCTYDTHTTKADEILPSALSLKTEAAIAGAPLKILYVGRADAMKGPMDWLDVLDALYRMKISFDATWIGDGPVLESMRSRVRRSSFAEQVHFPGFEGNREALLQAMKRSDLFLYCHKTPESPRSLIEALVCGCPIVGYETAYPRGLVQERGGGIFSPLNDVRALAEQIANLDRNRAALSSLIDAAAASGRLYNEDAVYAYRANLMRSV